MDEIYFKFIEKEKTYILIKYNTFLNFVIIKLYTK